MSTNFNDTTPSAPSGGVNVKFQTDGSGNDSAYVPSGSFVPAATNLPVTVTAVSGEALTAYDATTGLFTQATVGGISYSNFKTITIDHTACGSSDSAGFPFLFAGTYTYLKSVANGGSVNSQFGHDIAFSLDSAGTQMLPFEMQSYDPTSGAVVFWVSVPNISHTVDTVIYLQYGSTAVNTNMSNRTAVWEDQNFNLVRHFEADCRDSSGRDFKEQLSYALNFVAGKIGNGVSFGGSIAINDGSSVDLLPTNITTSMWIYPQSLSNSYSAILSYTNENSPFGGYALFLKSSGQIAI